MATNLHPAQPLMLTAQSTLRHALEVIQNGGVDVALVTDAGGRLTGILTDFDLRRALISGASLADPVEPWVNGKPLVALESASAPEIHELMRTHRKDQIPVVSAEGRVVGVAARTDFDAPPTRDVPVVILAGGRGERLRPFTESVPKPMLPLTDKPIVEVLIKQLAICGFERIHLAVHYKAEQIESYFEDGARFGVKIKYLHEKEPLGTAGCLTLLPEPSDKPLLVMNGDLVTRLHFGHMYSFHESTKAAATAAAVPRTVSIPYGVVDTNERGDVTGIREKPVMRFNLLAGVYVVGPEFIGLIPRGRKCDMPDLLASGIDQGWNVRLFPIHEDWFDIGAPDQYMRAKEGR